MRWPRSLLHHTVLAMLLAPVALCAGCWEKIEYTGPRTISTAPRTTAPEDQPKPAETTVADATSPPAVPETPPAASPAPPTAEAPPTNPAVPDSAAVATAAVPTPPKNSDDRYGLFTDVGKDAPPPTEATPEAAMDNSPAEPVAEARQTDATPVAAPVSAPADAAPPGNVFDSHRAAWHVGSRLSLAALANDRHLSAQNVPIWFEDAKAAAKLLGTTVDDLPEPAAADDKMLLSQQAFDYLVRTGQRIGPEITKQHGAEDAALFEVALKSNILMLLYLPDSQAGHSVAAAIAQAAPKAKLPDELWKPLVEALNKQVPQSDVRAAIKKMHVDVDRYLAERAEHKAQ